MVAGTAMIAGPTTGWTLTITPYFDSTIAGASNQTAVETAIYDAISTIDGLYSNSATIGIVFSQANGSFLGQSSTTDAFVSYSSYTSVLAGVSAAQPSNGVLASAVANLASGNNANGAKPVALTTADARAALGQTAYTGCFNTSGTYIPSCGQAAYGVVTLTDNPGYSLNYGTTAVAGAYSMVDAALHEIDEILGGGGQGSTLNAVASGHSPQNSMVGPLDLYRYSAAGTPSFSTSSVNSSGNPLTSYLSVDGGTTSIIGFNQNGSNDYADFSTNTNVQSAASNPGIVAPYNNSSPEVAMMASLGYNATFTGVYSAASGTVSTPEPASLAVLLAGLGGLRAVRRRPVQEPALRQA